MSRIKFDNRPRVRVWSEREKEKLRDLFFDGFTDADIGRRLGRTRSAIEQQRCKMRLSKEHQPHKEFHIRDAIAEYYPGWYRRLLKKKWQERYTMS